MPVYRDIYDGPPRHYGAQRTTKQYIAIHCTANTASAQAENSYAKRRPDSVSSHYYVDGDNIVQSLDTDLRAFHAGSRIGNDHAIAYEITGLTSWSRQRWLDSVAWPLLVRQIRRDMAAHNIAARRLTVEQMKAGKLSGIVTHNDMRLAWGGTDHTDPGRNFPMDHLMRLLAEEDDMPSEREIWNHRIPPEASVARSYPGIRDDGYRAGTWVQYGYRWARRAAERAAELLAGQAAILARLDGGDDGAIRQAIREELAAHRELLVDELTDIVDSDGDPAAVVAAAGSPSQSTMSVSSSTSSSRW